MKRFDDDELQVMRNDANYAEPYTPRFTPDSVLILIDQLIEAQKTIKRVKNVMSVKESQMETPYGALVWAVHTGDLMEVLDMDLEELREGRPDVPD